MTHAFSFDDAVAAILPEGGQRNHFLFTSGEDAFSVSHSDDEGSSNYTSAEDWPRNGIVDDDLDMSIYASAPIDAASDSSWSSTANSPLPSPIQFPFSYDADGRTDDTTADIDLLGLVDDLAPNANGVSDATGSNEIDMTIADNGLFYDGIELGLDYPEGHRWEGFNGRPLPDGPCVSPLDLYGGNLPFVPTMPVFTGQRDNMSPVFATGQTAGLAVSGWDMDIARHVVPDAIFPLSPTVSDPFRILFESHSTGVIGSPSATVGSDSRAAFDEHEFSRTMLEGRVSMLESWMQRAYEKLEIIESNVDTTLRFDTLDDSLQEVDSHLGSISSDFFELIASLRSNVISSGSRSTGVHNLLAELGCENGPLHATIEEVLGGMLDLIRGLRLTGQKADRRLADADIIMRNLLDEGYDMDHYVGEIAEWLANDADSEAEEVD